MRYFCFLFLVVAFTANAVLVHYGAVYWSLLLCQSVFYATALLGWRFELPRGIRKITDIPAYFLMSNVAFAVAAFRFWKGDTLATWKPRGG